MEPKEPGNFWAKNRYCMGEPDYLKPYKGTFVLYPFYLTLDEVEKFQARKDDVVILSFPKCGATLMSVLVDLILNDGNPSVLFEKPIDYTIEMLEMCDPAAVPGTRAVDRIKNQPSPRIYHTHLPIKALPPSILEVKPKMIYIARNPKDVIVSNHHFFRAMPQQHYDAPLEKTAENFMTDYMWYAPYFEHIAQGWESRDQENVFFMTFENLLQDFKHATKKLGKFLGKDLNDEQLDVIAYHCRFNVMKKNKNTNRSEVERWGLLDFHVSHFLRKGTIGNWKDEFSPELDHRVNLWIKDQFAKKGHRLDGFKFEYVVHHFPEKS